MLANCANPKCSNHFLRMSEGKLFWQETQLDREITSSSESHLQLVWFCDICASLRHPPMHHREYAPEPRTHNTTY